ncbi:hypothetical protein KWW51_14095 [Clostridioides difficile]|nr:hypothetical protein [Clostridioides difficile]MBY1610304.1 hypothetical protein [Clostridioides difficile]MBY2032060.1 hypothetical protein [Clostridioides difficile]MBY2719217.1 hypothetical protein [Clostridioides difficile]MBY2749263.1 hypothetical protein [Clostridioides difficile]
MKKIELETKEINLIICALDLSISRSLDEVYNNVPHPFKERKKGEIASMEILIDKLLNELDKVECEDKNKEALAIDWNMEEFKQVLREIVEEVNNEILTVDWNVEEFKETLREVVGEVVI